jgi:hypothetical protein
VQRIEKSRVRELFLNRLSPFILMAKACLETMVGFKTAKKAKLSCHHQKP